MARCKTNAGSPAKHFKNKKIINITFFPDINKLLVCIPCSSTFVKIQQSRKLSCPIKNITRIQSYQTRFERKHIITLTRFILNNDVEFNGNPMEFVPMTNTNGIRSTIEIYIIIKIQSHKLLSTSCFKYYPKRFLKQLL